MGTTNFNVVQADAFIGPIVNGGGNVLFVNSNAAGSSGDGSYDSPVTTFAKAYANAVAGDTIVLLPGHAETITGIGGLAFSKAGLTVVGMGSGSRRPRFLMDAAATVTAVINAAGVTVKNIILASGHADVATGIDVTAVDATIDSVEFVNNVIDENFVTPIKATGADNTADGLTIINCRNISIDAAAAEFLEVTGNLDRLTMLNNKHIVKASTAGPLIVSAGAKVLTNVDVGYNKVQNGNTANDVFIDNGGATNSGLVYDNYCGNLDVTGAQAFGAATGMQFFNNQTTSTSTESGALNPAADTPLS